MSIRLGASRRTRRGSVWISAPFWVVVLGLLLVGPYVAYWYLLKGLVLLLAWAVRQVVRVIEERRR